MADLWRIFGRSNTCGGSLADLWRIFGGSLADQKRVEVCFPHLEPICQGASEGSDEGSAADLPSSPVEMPPQTWLRTRLITESLRLSHYQESLPRRRSLSLYFLHSMLSQTCVLQPPLASRRPFVVWLSNCKKLSMGMGWYRSCRKIMASFMAFTQFNITSSPSSFFEKTMNNLQARDVFI